MGKKRTRDRHLAKLAVRRQAERRAKRRKRNAAIAVGIVVAVVAAAAAYFAISGGNEPKKAAASPSQVPKPKETGTVKPGPAPKTVACGATAPKTADEKRPQYSNAPPVTIDTAGSYTATMETSCGTIEMRLFADKTPMTVNNFVFLADQGFYDGLRFHRVVPGFVIQGGDPIGDGSGGPGYQFPNEVAASEQFDRAGLVAMANSGPNTNGSQFFITLGKTSGLTPDMYTIFGEVTKGLDVAKKIGDVPAKSEQAQQSVFIDKLTTAKG
jgi:cyclophilin family peptidyl-prolyl cis-trans isomerase